MRRDWPSPSTTAPRRTGPALRLPATVGGAIDLGQAAAGTLVLFAYPLLSDPDLTLTAGLDLPVFEAAGRWWYQRLTLSPARGGPSTSATRSSRRTGTPRRS